MANPNPEDSFYVQWHILDRCNIRCLHCYQRNFSRGQELKWQELKSIADNLLETMTTWKTSLDVAVTGGEPFLKKELPDLLHYLGNAQQVGRLSIITNGTIFPSYAGELAGLSRLDEIKISLDGLTAGTNDNIRGDGVTAKVLENITRWQELDIPITLMFTVMKRNLHEVPGILEFGKKLGLRGIIIERFFPLGRGEALEKEVLNGPEFLGVWLTILEKVGITANPADLIPYRAIRISYQNPEPDVLGSGCVVAKDGMALLPDGTVLPCRRFTLPVGNLLREPLNQLWHESHILNALRDKHQFKGKCGSCDIEECFGCRAMCYCLNNDFLAEDPHCWI